LLERLRSQERDVVDLGTDSEAACDYPEFAYSVANAVRSAPGSLGILVCATGQGMATAAGKVRGIRAVVPTNVEAARLSRFDNNANVLCLGSRFLAENDAYDIVDTWLATGFAGGRHARRIAKVAAIETASAVAFMTEGERLALAALGVPSRIFDRDPALFSTQVKAQPAIKAALAWLSLPAEMTERLPELISFTAEIRQARFRDLVLVVEDADNSPITNVVRFWGSSSGALRLHVLGDPEPAALAALEGSIHLATTLILVIDGQGMGKAFESKVERLWAPMLAVCDGDPKRAGGHFAAITCAGSRLAEIGEAHHYRKVFQGTPGIGEAFSGALAGANQGHGRRLQRRPYRGKPRRQSWRSARRIGQAWPQQFDPASIEVLAPVWALDCAVAVDCDRQERPPHRHIVGQVALAELSAGSDLRAPAGRRRCPRHSLGTDGSPAPRGTAVLPDRRARSL
jgi:ribose 5-phosphate isomerase B